MPELVLRSLARAEGERARGVLAAAFASDPWMRWCFLADRPGYQQRMQGYLEAGHRFHTALRQPVRAALDRGRLVGVLYAMDPLAEVTSVALRDLERELTGACGEEAARRFARYQKEVDRLAPPGRYHVLALVGVLPEWQGRGVGTQLVGWLIERSEQDPASTGVGLDTGEEDNLDFYARQGFEVMGRVDLADLTEWYLFWKKPRPPEDTGSDLRAAGGS